MKVPRAATSLPSPAWRARRSPAGSAARARADPDRSPAWRSRCSASAPRSASSSTRPIPNYDSYYSLLWGREVLRPAGADVRGLPGPDRAPAGDRRRRAAEPARRRRRPRLDGDDHSPAYLWLVAGVYRLGRIAFTPLVGAIAAALLLTRFDYAFLAARGYIDIPYMAMVVWAAALEAQRPRRGTPVLAAARRRRACCGPRRWVLAALYWCWVAWQASWRQRALLRRAGRDRPGAVGGDRLRGHRRPAVLAALHELARRRSSAASCRSPSCRRRSPSSSPAWSSCRCWWPRCSGLAIAVAGRAAARRRAAGAARRGDRDVRADRDRRRVGDRALPRGRRGRAAGVRRRRLRRLHAARAGPRCARGWMVAAIARASCSASCSPPRTSTSTRFDARAELPRRRARRPRRGAARPAGAGRPALRAADAAQPQARARRALDRRPALREGPRPRRPEAASRAAQGRGDLRHQPLRAVQARAHQPERLRC